MKKKTNGVWKLDLYRFGYDLTVVGRTKEECENAMRDEYVRAYASRNELDPVDLCAALTNPDQYDGIDVDSLSDDEYFRAEFLMYYRNAFEDCEARFYEYGKVEWE